jgi:hypothetical protein
MDKLRSGPFRATAVAALVVAVLAAATIVRPFGPGSNASPTPAPSVTLPASPTTPSTPSASPTAQPLTNRQRAQAIADQVIRQGQETGGRATAAGYVEVDLSFYGTRVNPPNPDLSPAPQWGDDLLVVEVDGWFPAARGLESPGPAATSATATNITVAWDLKLQTQIDVRFGFDPLSSEVPGASPRLGHHMTTLTTFGTDMVPLSVLPPDNSPERQQAERIVVEFEAMQEHGNSYAVGYLVTTLGQYRASGVLWCHVMVPESKARPCALSSAAADAWPSTSPKAQLAASDKVVVVEIDGYFWGGGYSRPEAGSAAPAWPADRFGSSGPFRRAAVINGGIVAYDLTAGVKVGETLLVGKAPGLWAISMAGTPIVLWDWTSWRVNPS